MAEKIVIAELEIDVNSLIKSTSDVKKVLDQLKEAQKELAKQGDTNSEQFVQNSADLKTLSQAYNANLKAIADSTNAKAEEANRTQLVSLALQSEVTSIKEAREQNSLLNKLRNETNATTDEGKKQIQQLNAKLDENNAFIKENADSYLKQKIGIGDYSQALNGLDGILSNFGINGQQARTVVEGFAQGVSNAGQGVTNFANSAVQSTRAVLGFKTASQLANEQQIITTATTRASASANIALAEGQTIATTATQASTLSLKGFTIALASTGIGIIVIAVGLLVNYFRTFDPLLDKIEQGFAALGAVVRVVSQALASLFSSTEDSSESFKNLGTNMANAAKDAVKLKQAQQDLIDIQKSQEVANARASQQFDELILKSKNKTLTEKERIAFLKQAEKIEEDNFKQRTNLANRELENAIEATRQKGALNEKQIGFLRANTQAYGTYLLNAGKITEAELELLNKADLAKIAILSESTKRLEKNQNAQDKLNEDAKAKEEKAIADQEAQAKAEADRRQKVLDDAVSKQKAEIDFFLSSQDVKAKTLQEQLKLAEDTSNKQKELARLEFEASKKTETDKLNFKTAINNATNTLLQSQTDLVLANAENELEIFKSTNQSKIDQTKFLSDEVVAQEKERNARLLQEQLDYEALRLEQGVVTQDQYNQAINQINADNALQLEELRLAKVEADKERDLIDLENKRLSGEEQFKNEFQLREQQIETQRQQELTNAIKTGASLELINKKFNAQLVALDKQKEIAKIDNTRNAISTVQGLLSGFFGDSKALNTALALADTFLSVQKAYLSQFLPIPTPDSPVRGQIAGLKALGFGLANVAKIQGLKFEQGGTMMVGGNRHAQGGTKFVGSDGTRFEAERGEMIGVLNRRASSRFMAFNDAFGSKGQIGTSYAQTGGIIARGMDRGVTDLQELAVLTANAVSQIPPPIVTVEDINTVGSRVQVIENGANFG